jgi:hypothetical protein
MTDEPSTRPDPIARLSELAADLRGLLGSNAQLLPPPVAFSVGDALEAVESAARAAGHVGLVTTEAGPAADDPADVRRRMTLISEALVALVPTVSRAARRELAVAIAELAPWRSGPEFEQASKQWSPQNGVQ